MNNTLPSCSAPALLAMVVAAAVAPAQGESNQFYATWFCANSTGMNSGTFADCTAAAAAAANVCGTGNVQNFTCTKLSAAANGAFHASWFCANSLGYHSGTYADCEAAVAAAVAVCGGGNIQTFNCVPITTSIAPAGLASVEGNSSSPAPFGRGSVGSRVQYVYDAATFTGQGIDHPVTIRTIRWRADGGAAVAGGSYANVVVRLGPCSTDHLQISNTFANNFQGVPATWTLAPVAVAAGAGTSPNVFTAVCSLEPGYVYDPTLGLDLVVEVTIPTGTWTGANGNAAASAMDAQAGPSTGGSSLFAGSDTSPTGTVRLGFAAVVEIGFSEAPGLARSDSIGQGCYADPGSVYERFAGAGSFDLSGRTLTLVPRPAGGFDVDLVPMTGYRVPLGASLGLTDDGVSVPVPLPAPFPYPGGSANSIVVHANGQVFLDGPAIGDPTPTTGELLARGASLGSWMDFDPSAAGSGNVHVDVDNQTVYVTWNQVFGAGHTTQWSWQLRLELAGSARPGAVEFRYRSLSNDTGDLIVGFTPGHGALDPGNRDLSALVPFAVRRELHALELTASERPIQGMAIDLVTSNVPANQLIGGNILSFGRVGPIELGAIGADGCFQHVALALSSTTLFFGGPTAPVQLAIPTGTSWLGAMVYAQSASLVPGANRLGMLTSNGLRLTFGAF